MNYKIFFLTAAWLLLSGNRASASISYRNNLSLRLPEASPHNLLLAQNNNRANRLLKEGTQHYHKNRITEAIASWQSALKLYRQQKNAEAEGATLGRIGLAYERLGNYAEAVNYFERSLIIAERTNDSQLEATIQGNLGNNYLRLGKYPQAITSFDRSLNLWQQLGNKGAEGQVLRGLGNVQIALGNYEKALSLHKKSLNIAQGLNDNEGLVYSNNSLGAIYANQGEYEQSRQQYQTSLRIIQSLGSSRLSQQLKAQTLNNLGSVTHAQSNLSQAKSYYQQSLAIAEKHNLSALKGTILSGMGSLYLSLDNYPKAKADLEQALQIARNSGDRLLEAETLHNLGYAQWRLNQLTAAESSFRETIALREQMRQGLSDLDRVSLFDTQLQSYPLLRRVLIAQNRYESALEVAEAERARSFVQLLASRLSKNGTSSQALKQQTTPPNIRQIKQIARQQKATLVEYSFVADENFVAQGKLHGDYKQIHTWVIQPTGEVAFRAIDLTPAQADIIKQAGNWATDWQNRSSTVIEDKLTSEFTELHQSLHAILIEPISAYLPTSADSPVIFIPQRELFQISFPALQDSNGKYLIEKHSILTAPAIQVLKFTRQQSQRLARQNNNKAIVVGNPVMPVTIVVPNKPEVVLDLVPLPGAEQEAQSIARTLNTTPLIGQAATETIIKKQISSARLIHFATHGLLDDFSDSGVPGAIALAPGNGNDGVLTSSEILDLTLNAELVVISACDTGRGLLTRDGVVGLSRSLLASGTPSVAIALWEIYDSSTAVLMDEFYNQLAQNQNKAQALRLAMLKTKEQSPHPINWGAFTLIGEAE